MVRRVRQINGESTKASEGMFADNDGEGADSAALPWTQLTGKEHIGRRPCSVQLQYFKAGAEFLRSTLTTANKFCPFATRPLNNSTDSDAACRPAISSHLMIPSMPDSSDLSRSLLDQSGRPDRPNNQPTDAGSKNLGLKKKPIFSNRRKSLSIRNAVRPQGR
ncbi:hypothetical protein LshimejAT787_0311020 [Lyophyllum shimeji]|uniref:Uncharacterized protein n=1 Tax=Lyophyllum shimeji TaxID=47721 RepID=A0A9P3PIZ1_LYOSH|nr:hypothetical protein LshimejAT787_0311020 [Lyophyllum shimeji]